MKITGKLFFNILERQAKAVKTAKKEMLNKINQINQIAQGNMVKRINQVNKINTGPSQGRGILAAGQSAGENKICHAEVFFDAMRMLSGLLNIAQMEGYIIRGNFTFYEDCRQLLTKFDIGGVVEWGKEQEME